MPGPRLRPVLLALALLVPASGAGVPFARAADTRIGYLDSARIFQEYSIAQEAQQRFDRQVQGWRDEATEKEKDVSALRAEVKDQSPILSSAKRQEKEDALQKAISDYEQFIQDIWGPQGRAAQENERATREIVDQIRSAVEKVANDKGVELVLDSAGGSIIYADKTMDMTGDVITELNTRATHTGAAGH
jgi:outer membrane protein